MKSLTKIFSVAFASVLLSACGGGGEVAPTAFPGLSVEGKSAYLASNLHVYKFDVDSSAEAWRFPPTNATAGANAVLPGPFAGEPVKVGNVIVVGQKSVRTATVNTNFLAQPTTNGVLFGLRENDGTMAWEFTQAEREFVDGVVSDGKLIFAPNSDGTLYALDTDKTDGGAPTVRWKFATENKLWGKPLLKDNVLYQPSLDHKLYAVNAETGKQIWAFQAGASFAATPILVNGVLYVGSFDSKMYAINAKDGSKIWESLLRGWVWNEAAFANGNLFTGDVRGNVYSIDAKTGKINWYAETGDSIRAKPVIHGNNVIVLSGNTFVYEFPINSTTTDGSKVEAKMMNDKLGRRLLSSAVSVDGQLLVPLFDGDIKIAKLNLETKEKVNFFPAATTTPK